MSFQYITETQVSPNWGEVASGETIHEGELIVSLGDGTFRRADPSADEVPDGIVLHYAEGDAIVEHDEDYVQNYEDLWKYEAGENFYWTPITDVDQIQPESLSDNGTDPAPSFTEEGEVGYVTINTQTEIVQAGYTDDADTEYGNGGTGDFVSLGRVDKYPQQLRISDGFDTRIPIRLDL